jgi:hypothetical protein
VYQLLSKENGLGWRVGRDDPVTGEHVDYGPPSNDPTFAAIRQIAHEIIATLERELRPMLESAEVAESAA